MKTILVPTDFSNQAQWATEVAIGIAKKANATIILLHVVEQLMEDSFNVEGQVSVSENWEEKLFTLKLIEKSKKQLEAAASDAAASGVAVKSELRAGNALHGIRTIILEHKADLIVMGTTGRTQTQETWLGSTTEKVARYATCPVLSIHEKPAQPEINNIVYATSLSDTEKSFVAVVKSFQELFNATVHIVRINTPPVFQPDHITKKALQNFASKNAFKNYTLNTFSDYNEDHGIIHFAEQVKADMITMATHGRTGLSHLLFNSIAEDVIHHSVKPVLTAVLPKQ